MSQLKDYELTVLVRVDADQDKFLEDINETLEQCGNISQFENDGKKRLAYEINGQQEAFYYWWVIEKGDENNIREKVNRLFPRDERIIRYLLIRSNKRR